MIYFWIVVLILLAGGALLFLRGRAKWCTTGLPSGEVVYSDTGQWEKQEKPLVSRRYGLVGRPDYLVRVVENGQTIPVPVEVKSRRRPTEPYASHILQLATYCLLVEDVLKVRPSYGLLRYADATLRIPFSDELRERVLVAADGIRVARNAADVGRDHQDPTRCRHCGYRRACGSGALALLFCLFLLAGVDAVHAQSAGPNQTIPPSPVALFLPIVSGPPLPACPQTSDRAYDLIPVDGPPADHPDELHGDLNLALRSYQSVSETLALIDINGPTDGDAPQLPGLFTDGRPPGFTSAHRVYDWDWSCGADGCTSPNLIPQAVSLLGLAMDNNEALSIPSRSAEIYGGGYTAIVLYASERGITLAYTRHDSVAPGYAIHLESLCVDPNLLALYRQTNADGRGQLPGLHNGDVLGTAVGGEVLVAVRDRGTFMDPRSRKDWWKER